MKIVDSPRERVLVQQNGGDGSSFSGPALKLTSYDTASFSDEFRDWLFNIQGGECGYCGNPLGETWEGNSNAHVEHIKPRRLGGDDCPPNLMYSCRACNSSKGMDHYSTLLIKRAVKSSEIGKFISWKTASKLIEIGALILEIEKHFHFERSGWTHMYPLPCRNEHEALYRDKFPHRMPKSKSPSIED